MLLRLLGFFLFLSYGSLYALFFDDSAFTTEELVKYKEAISTKDEANLLELVQEKKKWPVVYEDRLLEFLATEKAKQARKLFLSEVLQEYEKQDKEALNQFDRLALPTMIIPVLKAEFKMLLSESKTDLERIKRTIRLTGYLRKKDLLTFLLPYIAHPLSEIRKEAYKAMATMKDDRIIPWIVTLFESQNPLERTYALDALYYISDDRTLALLLKALKDPNKSVRYYAIKTLEKMKRTEALPYYYAILSSDADAEVKVKAIEAIARLKPRNGMYPILRTLSDKSPYVRRAAILALREYKNSNTAYPVSQHLAQETSTELQLLQIRFLLDLHQSGGMAGLNKMMLSANTEKNRLWAIYATGEIQDARGVNTLLKLLSDKSDKIRAEAAIALGKFRLDRTAPFLFKLLANKSEVYSVRSAALEALVKVNSDKVIGSLFLLSEKENNRFLRFQIKQALRQMLLKRYGQVKVST
ncbi:MAG: HEAT repeat domain-containing protein [Candidatus Hydrogenedentota bacterium]|nr:MAG: HEAT repeat domain-containing protein [Candidatus Hydrogenedentota bacterium]